MRVMHVVPGKLFGGVETHLVTLARFRNLCPDMEPHYGVCYEARLSTELRSAGVPVHVLGGARFTRPWTVWQVRKRLREVAIEQQIEVVICHMPWTQAVFGPAAKAAGCGSVIFLQNPVEADTWLEKWARKAVPDLVLGVSQDSARSSVKLYPNAPSEAIYSPMPEFQSHSRAEVRAEVRRHLDTPEEATVFLQASRMDVWKGHRILLDALGRLRDQAGWILWMAGGPQTPAEERYFAELKAQTERLGIAGRVRFLGQRSDVPRLMAAADVFSQANTGSEGFSWAFMEASAASLPIVTSAIGGAPEIIDESNGRLVPPNDPEALAAVLPLFIGHPERCRTMGAAGCRRVHQMCDRARQLRKLHDLLLPLAMTTTAPAHAGKA
ncbi:MAG TPA: glycosyltransferase [Bryobacteraceae bacterium]|jgi:glycosyltransferase involved in cell wall biosynthesis|nr:glycosyltransferase [Bryobacteraceae bacterium]